MKKAAISDIAAIEARFQYWKRSGSHHGELWHYLPQLPPACKLRNTIVHAYAHEELPSVFETEWSSDRRNRGPQPALFWDKASLELAHTLMLCRHSRYRVVGENRALERLGEPGIWRIVIQFLLVHPATRSGQMLTLFHPQVHYLCWGWKSEERKEGDRNY